MQLKGAPSWHPLRQVKRLLNLKSRASDTLCGERLKVWRPRWHHGDIIKQMCCQPEKHSSRPINWSSCEKMKQSILFKTPPLFVSSSFSHWKPRLAEKLHFLCILINVKLFFFFCQTMCHQPAGDRKCLRPSVRPHFTSESPRNEEADAPLNHRPCRGGFWLHYSAQFSLPHSAPPCQNLSQSYTNIL